MKRLFIIRHGDTFAPGAPLRRIGGRTDIALTGSGIKQACAIGEDFKTAGIQPACALAAPLKRTMQTLDIILRSMDSSTVAITATWLTEIDHGPDEGQLELDVVARLGAKALARWELEAVPPSDWHVDAEQRIAAWQALFVNAADGDTLVVTSNGMARFALIALGAHRRMPSLKLRTGAFGELHHDPLAGWALTRWNVRPGQAPSNLAD